MARIPAGPWARRGAAVLVLLGAAALLWLAERHSHSWDWTAAGRHTLSESSRTLLASMPGAVRIEAFVAPDPDLRRAVVASVARFQRHKPDLELELVDPRAEPDRAHRMDIAPGGELVLHYRGRQARVQVVDEARLTSALLSLVDGSRPWVVFTEGRGERSPFGEANHDLGRFAAALGDRGMRVQALDPDKTAAVPDNTAVLVLGSPQRPFTPNGEAAIARYLEQGGRVLWLQDPAEEPRHEFLARELGVQWLPGVVLSARNRQLGIDNPAFVVSATDPDAPVTGSERRVLLPVASALEAGSSDWELHPLLTTDRNSWNETGLASGVEARFGDSDGERRGPLTLGVSLQREDGPARAVVIGDGDFLANAYLDNAANRDFGTAVIHWLAGQDLLAGIARPQPRDLVLNLDDADLALLGWGFPFVMPAGLWLLGYTLRRRRRRR